MPPSAKQLTPSSLSGAPFNLTTTGGANKRKTARRGTKNRKTAKRKHSRRT
jgi:hypothetical protein